MYFDDILVSGNNTKDHLMNLRALFKRLEEKGLRCNRDKCVFAQASIDYLGHTLSSRGIAKGSKGNAILKMSTPTPGDPCYALYFGPRGDRDPR